MKRFIWILSGIVAALSMVLASSPMSANAININTNYGGGYQFLNTSKIYQTTGVAINASYYYVGGQRGVKFDVSGILSHADLVVNTNDFQVGSVVTLYMTSNVTSVGSSISNLISIEPNNNDIAVLDVYDYNSTTVKIDILVIKRLTNIKLIFSGFPGNNSTGSIGFIPGGFYTLENVDVSDLPAIKTEVQTTNTLLRQLISGGIKATVDNSDVISQLENSQQQAHTDAQNTQNAINNASEQAHQDSQAQLNYEKEQQQKEEDKANESLENDGSSAEINTSQGTNALNVFANIAKTTGSTCTIGPISAYGFNLGNLNLCHYSPPEWVQTAFAAVTGLALTWTSFIIIRRVIDEVIRSYKR